MPGFGRGGGFLGSHLCEALLAQDHEVRILERPRLGLEGSSDLRHRVEWIEGDFTNPVDPCACCSWGDWNSARA